MANKIKLGQRPKSFKPFPVKCTLPDGEEGAINCTFAYRTKSEFAKEFDALMAAGRKAAETVPDADQLFSLERFVTANLDASAAYLAERVLAWDVDEKIDQDSLRQLGDELPAALAAMMSAFRDACQDGRLGN